MKKHFERELKKLELVIEEREDVIEKQKEWLVEIAHWKAEHEKRIDEKRAIADLSRGDFDFLVVCVAGWIPTHTVIDVISHFKDKPMVVWGLTGHYQDGRLVTTAAQAGTTALRDPMDALGFAFKYIFDSVDSPYAGADKVLEFGKVARAAALLKHAKIGFMGYRDMTLYGTLADGASLRRIIGPDIEVFQMLEIVQMMEELDAADVTSVIEELRETWSFAQPVPDSALATGVQMYLAVMEKVKERGYEAVSLVDVDGVKKLLHFPPALPLLLLADMGGVASIPENDCLGSVTQLIVRYLTGQTGAYLEFYEFFKDALLMGVPDYVPTQIVDGPTTVLPWPGFGGLKDGILNISKVRTGEATICRLASRGDRYTMHIVHGEARAPRSWEEAGWEPPAPQLPSIEFVPDCTVDEFAQQVYGQHYILAYGDHTDGLANLCELLGIAVV